MENVSAEEGDRMIYEIMDLFVRNEYNCKLREIMKEWHEEKQKK
jgi:hypothetical protein